MKRRRVFHLLSARSLEGPFSSSVGVYFGNHRVGLDLDPRGGIDQAADFDHGRGRSDLPEDLAVRPSGPTAIVPVT